MYTTTTGSMRLEPRVLCTSIVLSFTSVAVIKHSFRFHFVTAGNSGTQELEVSNHITTIVKSQRERNVSGFCGQPFSLLFHSPEPQAGECSCPLSD